MDKPPKQHFTSHADWITTASPHKGFLLKCTLARPVSVLLSVYSSSWKKTGKADMNVGEKSSCAGGIPSEFSLSAIMCACGWRNSDLICCWHFTLWFNEFFLSGVIYSSPCVRVDIGDSHTYHWGSQTTQRVGEKVDKRERSWNRSVACNLSWLTSPLFGVNTCAYLQAGTFVWKG